MAYNKTKHIEAAQKYLNQAKIAQAIAEYQQILRNEPKDQVTLMTVGDLYVRQGETFQAVEYFERLAQVFLGDGFIAKAIAIYKKINKLAPEETKPLERLAELYVQQGVLSEARPIFLQLAEAHLKANRHQPAVAVLRKLLEVEPDNLRVQTRLGDLYQAMGQTKEAAEAYFTCAQHLHERGDHAETEKLAERALKLAPHHPGAQTLKARALIGQRKHADAIQLLEKLPDTDSGSEATGLLVDVYLERGDSAHAAALARRVVERDPKKYSEASKVASSLMAAGQAEAALELLVLIREAMIEGGDQEQLAQALTAVAERMPGRLEPLQRLVDLYGRTSDSFRLPDALAQLGAAAAAAGQLERAKKAYEELVERNPDDEAARQCLNQVRAKMGLEPRKDFPMPLETPQVKPALSEVKAAPARVAEAELDEETQRYVTQALTDVDLFSSYGLAQKAIDLLETVLQRAPNHTSTLEKLLDLYLGGGNERQTWELAARLEQLHTERGDTKAAERFSELRRRFQRAASAATEEGAPVVQPAEFAVPTVQAEPVTPVESLPAQAAELEVIPPGEAAVHEVDLSEEWATLQIEEPPETPEVELVEIQAEAPEAPAAAVESPASAPHTTEYEAVPTEQAGGQGAQEMLSQQFLSELVAEFEVLAREAEASAPETPAREQDAAEPLREVFDEFRAELGEMGAEEEDPETHYNLGIAYREMGLLEEAIGEFQRVAQANDKGRAFRYAMQCCTLLGLIFMDKGQPNIAAMWYGRALQTPNLDQESILALRYDLGVAQELSGDEAAALESFSQVYGMNIDYRDVGERIATLEKKRLLSLGQ